MMMSARFLRSAAPALAEFTAFIGLACLASCGDRGVAPAPVRPAPNIVLITLDTLRPDHTGPYGYEASTTSFLSGLAARSAVFERAFSTSSWTAPATASIFTGLYPNEHGVIAGFRAHAKLDENTAEGGAPLPDSKASLHERMQLVQLPKSRPTLVEQLADAGYSAYGIATNLNIGTELGFDRGYTEFERMYMAQAEDVAAQVLEWRERLLGQRPYFLYLHLNDVHMPYDGRPEFGYVGDAKEAGDDMARYDSEVRYLDHWVGELHREMGWDDDTVLMIVSDHGEEFGEHGRTGHRYSLYAELNDVLMMISAPGLVPACRVADTVSLIDVLPTLLDLAGVAAPADLEGRSLVRLAHGEADARDPDRKVFAHRIRGGSEDALLDRAPLWAVISGDWKLIHNGEEEAFELYDMAADSQETKDLAADHPQVVEHLSAELAAFQARSVRQFGDSIEIEVDDELLKQLEDLGYAGHD